MKEACIAIDVGSGDFGSRVIIQGVLDALQTCPSPFKAFLCGDGPDIERIIGAAGQATRIRDSVTVVHCVEQVSALEQRRSRVWKEKKDAAIIRCIALQKEGRVDASVSAGDTAVLLGAALFILGRRKNVVRPALAAFLPTFTKQPALLLDVGANLNCRKEHLVSFAFMGLEYIRGICNNTAPSVALLNIGKEQVKGTAAICEAEKILRKRCPRFRGFIEGNQVLSGEADVIVCDGFTGNVLLKTYESFHRLIASVFEKKEELLAALKRDMAVLDPENYGAVPLLGIKGIVFKAHGSSSRRAIASAVLAAEREVRRGAVAGVV